MHAQATEQPTTLLLVDDEPNILSSLQRVLRGESYRVLTAGGGEEALAILQREPVNLVVSDARMPGMDGSTLLALVQQNWPDCLRILLTGHADLTTTIRAINEGQIYRYISKPWDDDELRLTLRQALGYQHAERERVRLERLTREQNARLRELNATLEQRVQARTVELQQTADMLDLAYAELRRSYVTATEVFAGLINQRLSTELQINAQVVALVRAHAAQLELDEAVVHDLAMAGALYNIGKLTWDDELIARPSDLLYKEAKERYRQYPVLGESLLMALEPVQDAGLLIRHHQERWDGTGFPDHLKGEAIPQGSRLLKLAVDFVELQHGLILERRLRRDEAMQLLEKYSGRLYDPQLCASFLHLCRTHAPDLAAIAPGILTLDTRRLEPGMVLAHNLHAESGMLLLNAGKQLTRVLIDKLIAFEATEGGRYLLFVQPPKTMATASEGELT